MSDERFKSVEKVAWEIATGQRKNVTEETVPEQLDEGKLSQLFWKRAAANIKKIDGDWSNAFGTYNTNKYRDLKDDFLAKLDQLAQETDAELKDE